MVLCSKTRNRALSTHNSSSSINTFAESLLGDNYRAVDLTANASINVGDDDLGVPNMNTYSINSNTSTNTLYKFQSDEIGNITKIGNVTLDWNGRRLESISQSGTELISYEYNMDGQRVKKTVDGVSTEYFYNGSILAGQRTGNDIIIFMYDNNGDVFGFTYNGTPYYYVKNAQNDVIIIVDENNQPKVLYQYDAWGKVIECLDGTDFGLAGKNPIMYRSYYVDLEMGMFIYYLNSRYYVADWGRFASADSEIADIGEDMLGYNLFAYCQNNPVNMSDEDGNWPKWVTNLAKVAVGVVAIGIAVAVSVATGGAAVPVLVASVKIAATSAVIGASIGAGTNVISHRVKTGRWKGSAKAALNGAVDGAADGFMWGGISAGATFTVAAAKGIKIQQIGKLTPSNKTGKGYTGVQYKNQRGSLKSFELHSPHKGGPHQQWHWQQNTWNPRTGGITSNSNHWTLFGRKF